MRGLTQKKLSFCICLACGLQMGASHAANDTVKFNNDPLAGIEKSFPSNVVLALSVEYPTAGAAYIDTSLRRMSIGHNGDAFILERNGLQQKYNGYFDSNKCYIYETNGQYFKPSSEAKTESGNIGLCNNGRTDEYSGNIMNWITMTAIDIFRQEMTGGNRAQRAGRNKSDYELGDTPTETYLRRAYANIDQNAAPNNPFRYRGLNMQNSLLKRLVPHDKLGIRFRDNQTGYAIFYNHDFQTTMFTNTQINQNSIRFDYDQNKSTFVVVKTCDSNSGLKLEDNCVKQPNGAYKPEGLLQQYTRNTGMRFAALGYVNRPYQASWTDDASKNAQSHSVLRARMKTLNKEEVMNGITYGNEINPQTGQFIFNPDKEAIGNSGVINYLNQFGDTGSYKQYDMAAELYYAALRYLRGKDAVYRLNNLTPTELDNFPAIYNWDDPLTRGDAAKNKYVCGANSIILIGDTNTHNDVNIPNFLGLTPAQDEIQTAEYTKALLAFQGWGDNKWNANFGYRGSPPAIAGLAYWARVNNIREDVKRTYPDVDRNVNSFFVDVIEDGDYKNRDDSYRGQRGDGNFTDGGIKRNAYWLAAKFGGFDTANTQNYQYGGKTYKMPANRRAWTSDDAGSSSVAAFSATGYEGTPTNFAPANNPTAMREGLKKAFASANTFTDPSQAAAGSTVESGEVVSLKEKSLVIQDKFSDTNPLSLQSSFDHGNLSGDVIAKIIAKENGRIVNTEAWRFADAVNKAYHNPQNFNKRKVFTRQNGQTKQLNADYFNGIQTTGADHSKLANYVLGDNSNEGTANGNFRQRKSLIGTIVHSTVASILPVNETKKPVGCTYANESQAKTRKRHFAVAANDGMLHVFNGRGEEKLAFLPSGLGEKLAQQAKIDAKHAYLNDGSPVIAEMCVGQTATSVLVGTSGRGGSSVYALDVTNLETPSENNVLWEFSDRDDQDLGVGVSKVVLAKGKDNKAFAIFGSGYNAKGGKGALFILDVSNKGAWSKGSNFWKIELGATGVGIPAIFTDEKGVVQFVYVGDYAGKLWRIDYKDGNWEKGYGGKAMFTPTHSDTPITGAPAVGMYENKRYVIVGTGSYFDNEQLKATAQNYAYGFIDEDGASHSIIESQLVEQTIGQFNPLSQINTANHHFDRSLGQVSSVKLDAQHKGWKLKLSSGYVIASDAVLYSGSGLAEFYAVSKSDRSAQKSQYLCAADTGSTAIISVDLKTGGQSKDAVFDTDDDGNIDKQDQQGGVYVLNGIISPSGAKPLVLEIDGKEKTIVNLPGDTGTVENTVRPTLNPPQDAGRLIRINTRTIY